ncbi:MAG: hypothetical protein CME82_06185 [Halomonas sp.]|uniref:hypothetical protein n=1 Tax=Halomonas sp. DP1Y21-3 TaxID=2859080 RepID=UPI000C4A40CD|nr:hypothetical protein [Halomonas sp. DP1Y21-3]MAY71025.1 hypothetical protein [Halomonas sp.]MBY6111171.1 hypothetical protein [Halomonas sp. DP1Y21-3]|tara:strand:- start:171 stop:338 length:168 start_codon:yes stop_codon:yes gene_type:complete
MQAIAGLLIFLWVFGSWLTHLVVCFTEEAWGFLIAGAIFFPVAVVHGTGAWFGAW